MCIFTGDYLCAHAHVWVHVCMYFYSCMCTFKTSQTTVYQMHIDQCFPNSLEPQPKHWNAKLFEIHQKSTRDPQIEKC